MSSYRALGSRLAMRRARHRYVHSAYAMNAIDTGASAAPPRKEAFFLCEAPEAPDARLFASFGANDVGIVRDASGPAWVPTTPPALLSNARAAKRSSTDMESHCRSVRSFAKNVFGSTFTGT